MMLCINSGPTYEGMYTELGISMSPVFWSYAGSPRFDDFASPLSTARCLLATTLGSL